MASKGGKGRQFKGNGEGTTETGAQLRKKKAERGTFYVIVTPIKHLHL